MNDDQKFAFIRRKTRQRALFTLLTMGLYFSFALNYISEPLFAGVSVAGIPGPLVMFMMLIVSFIALELLFLYLNRNRGAN